MDEWTLNDLLECSVCLERLDTSSKVLPCQHTFCKKCLEEILTTHKELRCPECRILVEAKIEELPPNVLLMRILEGMKNAGNPVSKKRGPVVRQGTQAALPPSNQSPSLQPSHAASPENNRPLMAQKQTNQCNQAFARALYDYISKESGDLSFKKGDIIVLQRKIDSQWFQGECGGKSGVFPLSYVQVMTPLPNQIATCKALYDFRMTNDEEEGCLTFRKDEIITVIRRVDENWAEGKLNEKIGIFPLAFVELNNVARALMKLSTNSQPGPSRVAPPTPTAEESIPLIPTDHSRTVSTCVHPAVQNGALNNDPVAVRQNSCQRTTDASPGTVTSSVGSVSDSNSTVSSSSSTTPNSSGNTSSGSSTAPSSPASKQPSQNANPFLPSPQTPRQMILQTSHITNAAPGVLPTSHITAQQSPQPPRSGVPIAHTRRSPPTNPPTEESGSLVFQQQQREKRHSFSVLTPSHHNCSNSNRHSAEIISSDAAGEAPCAQLIRHGSQRHRRSGSDLVATPALPASYVALYPYKPQKADELELKKGGVYLVTERCQDGWFKGTSSKTQKCGVFPGNYVTLAKPVGGNSSRGMSISRETPVPSPEHRNPHLSKSIKSHQQTPRHNQTFLAPPDLPPRAPSPNRHLRAPQAGTGSWHSPQMETPSTQKSVAETSSLGNSPGSGSMAVSESRSLTLSTSVSPPPNVSVVSTPSKSSDKVTKEKKEKNSLMKRLTSMKRSKSPPISASYSMDNPVFDDSPTSALQLNTQPHPVHSSRQNESCGVAALASSSSSHRKSNSLDAGDSRKPRQLVPPVRERFRCIVPYPPNSEYELELRVGDIIYVHKKREDGWYKGTQQRTGRTGLFPASFVETY